MSEEEGLLLAVSVVVISFSAMFLGDIYDWIKKRRNLKLKKKKICGF